MVFEITLISYIPFKKRLLPIVEKVYFFKKITLFVCCQIVKQINFFFFLKNVIIYITILIFFFLLLENASKLKDFFFCYNKGGVKHTHKNSHIIIKHVILLYYNKLING